MTGELTSVEITANLCQVLLLVVGANMISGIVDIIDTKAPHEGRKIIGSILLGIAFYVITTLSGFNSLGNAGFVVYLCLITGMAAKSNSKSNSKI